MCVCVCMCVYGHFYYVSSFYQPHCTRLFMNGVETRLNKDFKEKLLSLLAQKNDVLKESHLLESLLAELGLQLDASVCPRTQLIGKTEGLVRMMTEIHSKPVSHFFRTPTSDQFQSELVPVCTRVCVCE
jgi:hypothetical protein